MKLLPLIGLIALTTLANAQQIVTLTATQYETNAITIAEDQVVDILSVNPHRFAADVFVRVKRGSDVLQTYNNPYFEHTSDFFDTDRRFAGPVTVSLENRETIVGSCTIEISPGQYPPGKSAVIGERDGPMKCTLEESTDLVNWTQSTSGQTHSLTNANAKKFFRIKLEQDVGP